MKLLFLVSGLFYLAPAFAQLTDGAGRTVVLEETPARVISLAPSVTEILFALELGDRLVGVSRYCDYPPAALKIPRVGDNLQPSLEAILAARPDLVFTAMSANRPQTVTALEGMGVKVYVTRVTRLDDLLHTMKELGRLMGQEGVARKVVRSLRGRVKRVKEMSARVEPLPVLLAVWHKPLMVAGGVGYLDELLELAGGHNLGGGSANPYPLWSIERVIAAAPRVIIIGNHQGSRQSRELVDYWRRWSTLPAVKGGRVHVLDGDLLFRPGPRLVDALEMLLRLLHPEAVDR